MTTKVVVPDLGESIVEATVGRWEKSVGDSVAVGDVLVTLETDKVDVEVGAEKSGVLAQIEVEQGQDVAIGDVLGIIEEGETEAEEPAQKPEKVERAEEAQAAASPTNGRGAGVAPPPSHDKEPITPVARRMAKEQGIDLAAIEGTGPGGRITKQDLEEHLRAQKPAAGEVTPDKQKPTEKAPTRSARPSEAPGVKTQEVVEGKREERIRMSRRRRTIAQRLVEAQRTAAMLTTFNELDMSAVIELRQRRRESFRERHGVKLGFMSFFVKASIGALKVFPRLNAELDGDDIILKRHYDIGMAIGAEEGLVVPVLRDADRMSFAEIEQTIQEYVEKTQNQTLSLEDLRGGTFTITNGGVYGSLLSTPILNPPQVGILGLHKIEERPIASGGNVAVRPMMYVALSYDHRIVDGQEAVQFLVKVKELIEEPEVLLLEG
jgi:2-oxoglutarate dehydrogenase E2 component (dihydrolipoamide succinyltransferase)